MRQKFRCASLTRLALATAIIIFNDIVAQIPGNWTPLGPSSGIPWIRTLLSHPDNPTTLFLGTIQSGIYLSKDAGLTWFQAAPPMNENTINALLWAEGRLHVGTFANGMFWSADGGLNWTQGIGPPAGFEVRVIIVVDGVLYAGTYEDGVFYSTNKGVSWTRANAPMDAKRVLTMIAANDTLLAGTDDDGIFYSTDKGVNWLQAKDPMDNQDVLSLISVGRRLYAGTRDGIFWSTNGGVNWTQVNEPMQAKEVTVLLAVGESIYAGTGRDGIFWSMDKGVNWRQANEPMGDKHVTTLHEVGGRLYAGTIEDGIFWSADGGVNWTQANAPMNEQDVTALLPVNKILYAATATNGVFRSTNEGRNWFGLSRDLANISMNGLLVDFGYIVAYGFSGAFQSADGGITWHQANAPLDDKNVATIISMDGKLYAGTRYTQAYAQAHGIFFSEDGGINWIQADPPMNDKQVTLLTTVNGTLYVGTGRDGVFLSNDGGMTWAQAKAPLHDKHVTTLLEFDRKLFAGTGPYTNPGPSPGLFHSADGGVNWIQANSPMRDKWIKILLADNGKLYAGTAGHGIFQSLDGGSSWIQANAPMQDTEVTALIPFNGLLCAGTLNSRRFGSGIFYSKDGGFNWTQAKAPMIDKVVNTLISVNGILYAGTTNYGVFRSRDGMNWSPLNLSLGSRSAHAFDYQPILNRLYAATDNGIYFQILDNAAPAADSMKINLGTSFTDKRRVSLIYFGVETGEADSMIFSENFNFSGASWKTFRSDTIFTLSSDDGLKTVYSKLKDISWNESDIISAKIILDSTNPEFKPHTPPASASLTQSVKITQKVVEFNLDRTVLYYRRGGEPWSEDRSVTFQADTASIDGSVITNRGIDYRIIASDHAGHIEILKNDTLTFFSIPVELGANDLGSSPGFPAGTGGSSYRLVSVPMKLSGTPSVKSVLGIRGKYGKDDDWRFWIYQGNDQWREGDNIPLQNGEGYFLILRNGGTLTNKVAGTTMETTAGVLGTIPGWRVRANDWTIIGNPYNTRIELSQLKLKGQNKLLSASENVWAYEGSSSNQGWTNEGIALERWSGLAIYSTREDTIVFANSQDPYAKGLSKSSSPITESLQENEWLVQIRTESGGYSDNVNYFGVRKDANAEQDMYDWYEPPIIPGGISVNFPHAEWQNPASFTSDIRPITKDGSKWQIRVNTSGGTAVTLNFEQLKTVPQSFEVLLLDESNHLLRDLRKQPQVEVRIPQETDTKKLTILVGKPDFVESHTTGLRAIPQSFALHQNYPNPFNPTTVIRYELPVAGKITLKLYNLLGKEVMILENDASHEPGYYERVVDLRSFASGIYFYRISVSGERRFEATKKMVLAK